MLHYFNSEIWPRMKGEGMLKWQYFGWYMTNYLGKTFKDWKIHNDDYWRNVMRQFLKMNLFD